ncbi:PREDICTED: ribonuclease P/MRP protein subunit POP5 [Sturnus vulgaris]|uniref:ribonuclease P/MRP protein subunit POP5 n=1 Tax=Sturnus vulgaris TaxID=9172 RepID=UPI00071A2A9D|nr:PREDICTED: ribonuclease P/MRP protein subunit POP5 [Sturnus vulgaris]
MTSSLFRPKSFRLRDPPAARGSTAHARHMEGGGASLSFLCPRPRKPAIGYSCGGSLPIGRARRPSVPRAAAAMVRFKNRYVLCEVVSEDPRCRQCIEDRALGLAVRDAIARVHGDYGLACCSISFTVKYLNAYTGTVLLRCRKDSYRLLCSALPFVRSLESRAQRYPCFLNTLHVGGTIRTCQKFLIQYNRTQLLRLLQNCTNEEERQSVQKSLLSCSLTEEQSQSGDEEEEDDDDGIETD